VSTPERSTVPGVAPVSLPFLDVMTPFTMVQAIRVGSLCTRRPAAGMSARNSIVPGPTRIWIERNQVGMPPTDSRSLLGNNGPWDV